ncbi:MAG: hypothetical protein KF746_24575 [Chitinophagaceae bacterium]|nr:hypothetical protein [Chitinophagaceae bacterium]
MKVLSFTLNARIWLALTFSVLTSYSAAARSISPSVKAPLQFTDISGMNRADTLPLSDSAAVGLMYRKKARTERTMGIVLSSAGVIAAVVGAGLTLVSLGHLFEPGYKGYGNLPDILGYGGLALVAVSIPFYIVSGSHAHKAKLYLKYQRPAVHLPVSMVKGQISATVAICF